MIRRPRIPTLSPTRRSSDLGRPAAARVGGYSRSARVRGNAHPEVPPVRTKRLGGPAAARRTRRHLVVRSEEHTSELQSQSNLVCRLLLAKKINTLILMCLLL